MVFMIAFCVFILFFVLMSLSLLISKKPLKGSCGGVASLMGNKDCEICGGDPDRCATEQKEASTGEFYDASREKHPTPNHRKS